MMAKPHPSASRHNLHVMARLALVGTKYYELPLRDAIALQLRGDIDCAWDRIPAEGRQVGRSNVVRGNQAATIAHPCCKSYASSMPLRGGKAVIRRVR